MNNPIPTIFPAPAKINLHLKITAILNNGYHALDTSFVFVDIIDQLHITPDDALKVTCSSQHLEGENNLVYRVLKALQKEYKVTQGLAVHIEKVLPEQAGLGGGSSDAATAILAANHIWKLNISQDSLIQFATPLGADIPCFLYGQASQASGIGEQLINYPFPLPKGHLLLAHPGIGLSTEAVFQDYDLHHLKYRALTHQKGEDTIRDHSNPALGMNDLEQAACHLAPEVERLLSRMREHCKQSWMSGSGSSCIALLESRAEAVALAEDLKRHQLATWTHVGKLLAEHPMQHRVAS
ncbi:MAG: 4-(cytidine 5'-diphospho)-2-C-methyl-D-erythritol kinase [Mariprofundaceae bacterium]